MSFGPVILGEREIHVTDYSKDGIYNSHLTWFDETGAKKYDTITTMKEEDIPRQLQNAGTDLISPIFNHYSESDEALVLTDEGQKVFREAFAGSVSIVAKGRKLHFDFRVGYMMDVLSPFENAMDNLFRVGKGGRSPGKKTCLVTNGCTHQTLDQ
jgi:adenine specific DNA methylase Mod